ncbi:MAG: hypothetical protein AB1631_29230 [Acidobacteriota bacterium]
MKKIEITFDSLPSSALSTATLTICLKCAFDFFTKQLGIAPRTAYIELKKHTPEETDFSGASTARPHFFEDEKTRCPYCNAARVWFARFRATRIDSYPSFEKERKKLWTALKRQPNRFVLSNPERTGMQIFSEWLERLNRKTDFASEDWMLQIAIEEVKRAEPSQVWDEIMLEGINRVQLSRHIEGSWHYEDHRLFVSSALYGDILIIQHLLSRSHQHGGTTFEGRLTLQELMGRLRKIGYHEAKGLEAREHYEAFEQAVTKLVASGPTAVYYAVDRSDYLEKLKTIYEKKLKK